MFLPAWFGVVLILCWLVLGGLAGALVGRAAARALRLAVSHPGADAAAGAAGVLLVLGLAVAIGELGTLVIENGVTQGWRAVLLDHMLLWGIVAVCGAVLARQLVAARLRPRAPAGPGAPAA